LYRFEVLGIAWVRSDGNVLIDPVSLSEHDLAHLNALGGAAWIIVTNSDHVRAANELAQITGAQVGDGWSVFRDGSDRLKELASAISTKSQLRA
jgi:glyoxylase-like metal-dependent hydrolase (beta-lactamase superfamily II)